MRIRIRPALIVCVALLFAPSALPAQNDGHTRAYAGRADLEKAAAEYGRQASDPTRNASERAQSLESENQVKERLRMGDFRVGDRIVLRISGATTFFDTMSVTPARTLRIPEAGDISVEGVLRGELQAHLETQLARYVRNTVVNADPLTRLAVLGEVRNPGFVHVPSQSLLSDVISAAGGPTANGRLDQGIVRRSGRTLVPSAAFARALAAGLTLDDLDIKAGDEIVLDPKRAFNWTQLGQTAAVLVGSAATIVAIRHR